MKKAVWILAPLALFALSGGCVVRGYAGVPTVHATIGTPPPPRVVATVGTPPPPTIVGTVTPPQPVLIGQVQTYTPTCNPAAQEVLNGIDDNCNGMVDEGFVGTGNLQIALSWDTTADLDLHVTDPYGFEINYMEGHRTSNSGGQLDRDDQGACYTEEDPIVTNNSENVFWSGDLPAGHYSVRVHSYDGCGSYGTTNFILTVTAQGQIVGAYQYAVNPEEEVEVIAFDL